MHRDKRTVEGGKASTMRYGERHEVGVSDLLVTIDTIEGDFDVGKVG